MDEFVRKRIIDCHLFERLLQITENRVTSEFVKGCMTKEEHSQWIVGINKESRMLETLLVN